MGIRNKDTQPNAYDLNVGIKIKQRAIIGIAADDNLANTWQM
jgi:hypothetical protein